MKLLKHLLVLSFVSAGIFDLVTAFFALPAGREANPIYLMSGFSGLVVVKVLLLILVPILVYKLEFTSELVWFLMVALLIQGSYAQFQGGVSNLHGIKNMDYYVEGAASGEVPIPTKEEATEYYYEQTSKTYTLPIFWMLGVFWLYASTRKDVRIRHRFQDPIIVEGKPVKGFDIKIKKSEDIEK